MIPIDVTPPLDLGVPVSPLPAITSFTSNSGPVGTSVTITGTGFTGATSFKFNGTPALFLADSDTTIIAVVPAGAATGKLTVTTAGGTGTSADTFTVTVPVPAPTITNFTPASGPVGTSVTISGANFSGATEVSFNGTAATFTVDSDTSISTSLPAGATTGTISVTTAEGTATSADTFTVTALPVPAPTITSFSPDNGPVGTNVTISGANFSGATDVSFNGTAATFTVDSDTSISASVPAGATTGTISVTTAEGTGTSVDTFTVTVPVPAPAITSFTPTSGPVGTSVTISGANFSGAIDVSFNGAAATFTVDSDTSISASVPAGATTGTISVTTAGGTATSADPFTVTVPVPAPAITSFTPASGPVGTSVTISGANFSGATNVNFNGTAATFTVNSDTSISASVPAGATTGTISVTTVGGTATSPANFTVTVTDSLTVTIAEYRTGKGQWRIDGTSSIIGPSTITIYLGTGFTGPIIGTAQVNNLGVWRFRPANNTVAGPGAIRTISIRSSNGGELIGITLTVRN
ncbi:MAG: IPT/TIG domain-containing protein [Chloroflexi bacterium]|nr:IPT/TIG domain-containing protein [Chloroflexota bacterium]